MDEKTKVYTHPSYAIITSSRISRGQNCAMFGTSLKTNHPIRIEIRPAELRRDLNHDWYHGKRLPFIEIEMSEGQWAQFVSSMNVGEGTPCTVKHLNGEAIDNPPFINKLTEFQDEFQKSMEEMSTELETVVEDVVEMLQTKKNINKTDRQMMLRKIDKFVMNIKANMPYVAEKFGDQMEKVVDEAKNQINTHYQNIIVKTGMDKIAELQSMKVPQITEGESDEK